MAHPSVAWSQLLPCPHDKLGKHVIGRLLDVFFGVFERVDPFSLPISSGRRRARRWCGRGIVAVAHGRFVIIVIVAKLIVS